MKRVRRWRYYCDFCKKSGASGWHMANHERGCTLNPERVCGFCETVEERQRPMADLIAALGQGPDWRAGLAELRDVAEHCPACILAAIRQSPKLQAAVTVNEDASSDGFASTDAATLFYGKELFDFNAERKSFWHEHNIDYWEPPYVG